MSPKIGLLSFPPEEGQLNKPYSDDTGGQGSRSQRGRRARCAAHGFGLSRPGGRRLASRLPAPACMGNAINCFPCCD